MRVLLIFIAIAGLFLGLSEQLGYDYYLPAQEIGTGLAIALAIILFLRANKRWTPVQYFSKNKESVKMKAFYTKSLKKQVFFSRTIEFSVLIAVGVGFLFVAETTAFLGRIMLYGAIENIVYMLINNKPNRFGFIVNEKAILSFSDKLETITWESVQLVEEKYNELFFTEKAEKVTVFKLQFLADTDKQKFLRIIQEQGKEQGFGEIAKIS